MTADALRHMAEAVAALQRALHVLDLLADMEPLPVQNRRDIQQAFTEGRTALQDLCKTLHDEARKLPRAQRAQIDAEVSSGCQ
jgi:hypothetical protein